MKINLLERIANYLYGYCRVRIDGYSARALTGMMRGGVNYWGLTQQEEAIEFFMPCKEKRLLCASVADCGCSVSILRVCGAMNTAKNYRRRPGLFVGALLFAAILWASTYFVWDISVTGNSTLTDWQIIDSFEEYGMKFGAFIPSLDLDSICQKYMINSEDVGWVSVNLSGTCADIVVRERTDKGEVWEDTTPSNVVAAEDGQITGFCIWSGEGQISLGQVVSKGQLLISGISDIKEFDQIKGYRLDRSYGSVWAQVYREYTEQVPLAGQRKVYTGKEEVEKNYKFFTKALKTFGNSGKNDTFYDKIIDNERVILFGFLKLPVFVTTTVYREFEYEDYILSEEQAAQLAQARMMQRLADELTGCDLISKQSEGKLDGDVYTLTCKVYCIADIAKEVEIENGTEDSAS